MKLQLVERCMDAVMVGGDVYGTVVINEEVVVCVCVCVLLR